MIGPAYVTRFDVLTNPRFAGEVERYHTWPVRRRQSIGEHSWQVMRIYYQIWGPLSPVISTYLLWHDAGELVTGDLPFPAKANNPTLKAELDALEKLALEKMGGALPDLTSYMYAQVKCCDLIDMLEFGRSEVSQGNAFGQPIIDDILKALEVLGKTLLSEDHSRMWEYIIRMRGKFPRS